MFTMEIRVNGTMIGHVYGRNLSTDSSGKSKYKIDYYKPELPKLLTTTLYHKRDDGIEKLVETIMQEVQELI